MSALELASQLVLRVGGDIDRIIAESPAGGEELSRRLADLARLEAVVELRRAMGEDCSLEDAALNSSRASLEALDALQAAQAVRKMIRAALRRAIALGILAL